jgi:4-hydroxyproline epimerase
VIGSVFEASGRRVDGRVLPTIVGSAYLTAKSTLVLDPDDPFVNGVLTS